MPLAVNRTALRHTVDSADAVSQSLAGRTSVLRLLPLSYEEQRDAGILPETVDAQIFTGGYPRIFDAGIPPGQFHRNYISLYTLSEMSASSRTSATLRRSAAP